MASNVTRDHHSLIRNLKLNGNYISNDGGDEGILISDAGVVTASSQIDIGNMSLTTSELDISSGDLTLDVAGDITLKPAGDNIYFKKLLVNIFDFDTNAQSLKIMDADDTGDYFSIAVGDAGVTTITTVDDNAAAAHLTLDIDGDTIIDRDINSTTASLQNGLKVDFDRVGDVSTGFDLNTGIDCNVSVTGASGGSITTTGMSLIVVGDTGGSSTVRGLYVNTSISAATYNYGIYLYSVDGGFDFRNVSSANVADYFQIQTIAEGATTLSTVDAGSAVAHLTLDADGDVILDPNSGITKFYLAGDTDDLCTLTVAANGATTIATADSDGEVGHLTLAPDGDVIIDRNVSNTSAGTYTGLSIDYDKTGASTSDNTLYGLNINLQNLTATNGTNDAYGIYSSARTTHAADAGTINIYGAYILGRSTTNGTTNCYGAKIVSVLGDTVYGLVVSSMDGGNDFRIESSVDEADYCQIATTTSGATTLSTVDGGAAVAHLNIEADGHVEFDGCAVGFDLITPTYGSDTTVDFKLGNKQFVTFDGGNITNLLIHFPNTSGNFVCLVKQDGTGSRLITSYKAFDSAGNAANGSAATKFAGGSNPTLTTDANHVDIISFFWDADTEIAYAVASLDFQF